MTTDRLTATLAVVVAPDPEYGGDPVTFDVGEVTASVTLDQGWAPFATAECTFPRAVFGFLPDFADPRWPTRGTLTLNQSWGESHLTLDDLSTLWAGLTLDDLSTLWAGLTLDDLSDQWGDRWGNPTWRGPETLTLDLGVRRRRRDYVQDTITLTLMSDERMAQESAPGEESRAAESLSIRFTYLLGKLGDDVPVTIDLGAYGSLTAPAIELGWATTVWEALEESATALELRVWCDEHRTWRVTPTSASPTTTVHLPRVTTAEDVADRDGDWADLLRFVDVYTAGGTPALGILDRPEGSLNHRKMRVYVRELGEVGSPPVVPIASPHPDAVANLATGRGLQLRLTAPIDLAARPGIGLTTGLPSLPSLAGQVEQVTFDLGAAEMTLTTRDTITGA